MYTFQGAGGLLLDVNARTIEVRRDGATCMYFKAQGTLFASGCWMSRHRRSDETRWGCLHTFQSAGGLCLPRAARCERTGHRGEAGWGNLHVFQGTGDFVCLGLLDVNARTIEARRDGGLACISRSISILLLGHRRSDETRWGNYPCVHIQHAETNQFLMRLDIHMQALHLVGFCHPCVSHPAARDKHSPLRLGMYASYPIPPRLDGPFLKDHNLFPLAQRAYSMGIIFPE